MYNISGLKLQAATESKHIDHVLTKPAVEFLVKLQRKFNSQRLSLLEKRIKRQEQLDQGELPTFLSDTQEIRERDWQVAATPHDLQDRRVEITGPTDAKMIINALNSGAKVFMADLEDASSPTWENMLDGQLNLKAAVRHQLSFTNPSNGKTYKLKPDSEIATLLVRPRGWHLTEKNLLVDDIEMSASLFDFGLYFFHNAKERLARNTAPYFYLPKMESHLEARLWNDVFIFAQEELGIPKGTIRATCLIENILAAFEMNEILFELKDHASGLNAGRWDYIFSVIKKFKSHRSALLPDRSLVTMHAPFMKAYTELLIKTCHKRNAHAIGGMAAFIPSRKDEKINEIAISKVTADKQQEASSGCDGTWVAHPDLVPVANGVFTEAFGDHAHQKHVLREDVHIRPQDLCNFSLDNFRITEDGVRSNIRIAIQYMNHWLNGLGAVALHHLMEDAATAEISRAQLWQWVHLKAELDDGRVVTPELYSELRQQELEALGGVYEGRHQEVIEILDGLVLSPEFTDFLTLPAYRLL
ncbi:malate synthase A [Pseudobacteriovorax antillogorgiicola]|uniref:Malate synthase n=1 Tax=Pseudobacteriovorax antillogorgiicola TaxID=1513793 RepID=A0A1Y6BXA2_9BACT|nr:malate synthase A [Pseudobacteriovorax antillogorgiicola]TCS50232.1 malate synthase [Pseudobacteriovorax antillogorgiicola]SMF32705.1 malate synthase [Pseudobacteriovorax antillogorgiicola]